MSLRDYDRLTPKERQALAGVGGAYEPIVCPECGEAAFRLRRADGYVLVCKHIGKLTAKQSEPATAEQSTPDAAGVSRQIDERQRAIVFAYLMGRLHFRSPEETLSEANDALSRGHISPEQYRQIIDQPVHELPKKQKP